MSRMSLTLVLTPPKKGRSFLDLSPTPCVDLQDTDLYFFFPPLLFPPFPYFPLSSCGVPIQKPTCSQHYWVLNLPLAKKKKKKNAYFDVNMQYEMTGPSLGRNALNSSFYWNCGITYLISPCMMSVYSALVLNSQQETWGDKHSLWRCHHGFFFLATSKWMFRSFLPFARRTFWHFTQSHRNPCL